MVTAFDMVIRTTSTNVGSYGGEYELFSHQL